MKHAIVGWAVLLAGAGQVWAQNTWDATKAPLPTGRVYHASAGTGGYLYVFAGQSAAGSWTHVNLRYDPVANSWETRGRITDYDGSGAILNPGWQGPAGAAANGKVYQFAGSIYWNSVSGLVDTSAYEYDPASDAWTRLPSTTGLFGEAQAVEMGGKIYIAGTNWSTFAVLEFDPAARTYVRKADLPVMRYSPFLGALNGKVWIAGGYDSSFSVMSDEMYELDPSANTWTLKTAKMPMGGAYGASVSTRGRFFALGGFQDDFSTNFAYNPMTGAWETLAPMPAGLFLPSGAAVASQGVTRIHVAGGGDLDTWGATSHFVYTPPALPKPSDPTGLFMRLQDGTLLPHGGSCGPQLSLGAVLADPNNLNVRLEVEVVPAASSFSGNPTQVLSYQAPGTAAVAVALPGGQHKWRARCRNINDELNPGGWIAFGPSDPDLNVDLSAPGAASPLSPKDSVVTTGSLNPTPVEFTWLEAVDDSAEPVSYLIHVSSDPTFSVIDRVWGGSGSSATIHLSWSGQPQYWRIQATDSRGNTGAWSAVAAFELRYEEGAGDGSDRKNPCAASAAGAASSAGLAALLVLAGLGWFRKLIS